MFERFTDRARHVISCASNDARHLGHARIGTTHLLLGLIIESRGIAGQALVLHGVGLDDVRRRVREQVNEADNTSPRHLELTPRAKTVLELALHEAGKLGHPHVGTEHILLGIINEREEAIEAGAMPSEAAMILGELQVDIQQLRQQVMDLITTG